MYCIYLDADPSVWQRTSAASITSASSSNSNSPSSSPLWQDATVEFGVSQSFATITHIMQQMSAASSSPPSVMNQQQQQQQKESNDADNNDDDDEKEEVPEFTSLFINGSSQCQVAQSGFTELKDIGLPLSWSSSSSQQHQHQQQEHADFHRVPSSSSSASASGSTSSTEHSDPNMARSSSTGGGGRMDFFGPISLATLISSFTKQIMNRFSSSRSSSSSNDSINAPRLVALLGRGAGIRKHNSGEGEDLMSLDNSLRNLQKLLEKLKIEDASIDFVLLPQPLTIAALHLASITSSSSQKESSSSSSSGVTADEDLSACRTIIEKVKDLSSSSSSTVPFITVHAVRVKDCSDIGGNVAKAFLQH